MCNKPSHTNSTTRVVTWYPGHGDSDPATAALTDDGLALVASRSWQAWTDEVGRWIDFNKGCMMKPNFYKNHDIGRSLGANASWCWSFGCHRSLFEFWLAWPLWIFVGFFQSNSACRRKNTDDMKQFLTRDSLVHRAGESRRSWVKLGARWIMVLVSIKGKVA